MVITGKMVEGGVWPYVVVMPAGMAEKGGKETVVSESVGNKKETDLFDSSSTGEGVEEMKNFDPDDL